jgi:predicted PurR-regulated permease PerM
MNPLEIRPAPLSPPAETQALAQAPEQAPALGRSREDLARTTLAVFFMTGLAAATLCILRPFVPALVWATMIVVATWPLMLSAQQHLWQRRWLAVIAMTAALLLTFVIPFLLAVMVIVWHAPDIGTWMREIPNLRLPALPEWIGSIPVAGPRVSNAWSELAAAAPEAMTRWIEPYAKNVAHWTLTQIGSVGLLIVQFGLTVIISAILFARGEQATAGVLGFFRRLAGVHGESVVILAAGAIRDVALGVVLTALVQSMLGGIGLAAAGVPFPGLLTALMFLLAIAQIGPTPVLIGAVVWVYAASDSAWVPAVLLIWSIGVGAMDNVLRPILIRRGGNLPLLIVFAGVIGGLLGFGLAGIFLGPVVLAVVYTLLKAWVSEAPTGEGMPVAGAALPPTASRE